MVTKHWADLPVLCGCFPLAIYLTFGSVYKSMPLSHFVPAYPSPSLCPQVYSLHLRLYSCPAPRFFITLFFFFFRFHIYVLAYGICFSLSDLLHSVWQILGPSTSLQITQLHFFLWLSNIPLYVCATWKQPKGPSTDEWIKMWNILLTLRWTNQWEKNMLYLPLTRYKSPVKNLWIANVQSQRLRSWLIVA